MPLTRHPAVRAIVLCDYSGFIAPEMIKRRPAVVLSPRLRHRENLCTVVPLSGSPPDHVEEYHCQIEFARPLPKPWDSPSHWVKADMLATVALRRLDLIAGGRDHEGKRKYLNILIREDDFRRIQDCVRHALGLLSLTEEP